MAALFENPLFLFVDEAEPILPMFRSPEYSDSERKIVELADVGCDTETTFPIHFLRGKFNRRRGEAEGLESARKIIKRRHERSTNFSACTATILNDFEDRKEKYMKNKSWRNDRNDVHVADLDYDSCTDDSYNDWTFSNNAAMYSDYYTDFVRPRNMIRRFWKECPSQEVRYSRNYEIPFSRNNRVRRERDERAYYQRENTCPLWFANNDEGNIYETRNTNGRSRRLPSNEHRKRMRIFPRADNEFNRDAGDRRNRVGPERREDASFDYINSVRFSRNDGWDFTSLEDEPNYEELTFSNSATANNHRHLWETTSQNFNSQQIHVDITDLENSEFTKIREKNNFVDSSSRKNSIKAARYEISKRDATAEKFKTFRSNFSDTNTPYVGSTGITTDQRLSNVRSTETTTTNLKLHSAVEEKKNDVSCATPTFAQAQTDNRRHPDNFGNVQVKLCNETRRSTKDTSKLSAASRSNERTYRRNHAGFRVGSANKIDEIDRVDRTVPSQSTPEKVIENEGASILGLPSTSPRTEAKKKRKVSRLPVRTWKRVQTRGPVALHLESKTSESVDKEIQQDADVVLENAQFNKPRGSENDEEREKMARDRASRRRGDLKPNNRHGTGVLLFADKPESTCDLKDLKETKSFNILKGTPEQRRKKTN